eukprot:TRINITY_DN2558_c0_g2_i1.p1 TRINITY_DN2558_c0_g2~~TRINITY_DN2558_c0_g2_i1.p1  ORF type:complete len:179 (-),score=47.53 TRINITY_DN2558_c0_g2_i1:155-691(-)
MLITYTTGHFPDYKVGAFDEYSTGEIVDGVSIRYDLWDSSGKPENKKYRYLAYPDTTLFFLCFSVVDRNSFNNVLKIWEPEISENCPQSSILLLGMKTDLRDKLIEEEKDPLEDSFDNKKNFYVSFLEGKRMAKVIGAQDYFECSSLQMKGLKDYYQYAFRLSLHDPHIQKKTKCNLF